MKYKKDLNYRDVSEIVEEVVLKKTIITKTKTKNKENQNPILGKILNIFKRQ